MPWSNQLSAPAATAMPAGRCLRTRTRYISIIRALLPQHGYRVPSGSAEYLSSGSKASPAGPRALDCRPAACPHAPLDGQLTTPTPRSNTSPSRIRACRAALRPQHRPPHRRAFLAAIDDAQRFHHAHPLEAYLGRCPASAARARRSGAARSPRPATRALLAPDSGRRLDPPPPPPQAEELRTWARASPRAGAGGRGRPRPSHSPASSMRYILVAHNGR